MLGHVLKGVVKIFIYLSMKFAIYMSETVVGRQSCHQMNLFQVIKKDLQPRGLYLNNLDDLNRLREGPSSCILFRLVLRGHNVFT